MMKFLPKKSKKGVTLVESVIAVVVLGMLATGILTLLTTGGMKIQEISGESKAYAEATQKLDLVISSISNGSADYLTEVTDPTTNVTTVTLNAGALTALGFTVDEVNVATYDGTDTYTDSNVRGWYLTLEYKGVIVKGFASNSGGVFDSI